MLCSFSTEEYACASPIGLTAQHLVTLLKCKLNSNVTSSKETWKLFITKVSGILDEALDLFSNMMASSDNPSTAHVLDVIGEIRIDSFSTADLRSIPFVNQWFQIKLKPFLPSVSKEFLSCLSTKNFSCETYQAVLKTLNHHYSEMDSHRQMLVYSEFVDIFLSQKDTADPGCISSTHGSADWLERNFGNFAAFASFTDLQRLNKDFSATDAYGHFTTNQLAEVASIPGHLKNGEDVKGLMDHVNASSLDLFFDMVSPAVQEHESMFPVSVRSEMLQQVFDRGGLAEPSVSDADVQVWLTKRLRPLLANLSEAHVAPYFSIVKERHCITSQEAVEQLDYVHSTLHSDTQTEIYNHILASLKGPDPLRCYESGSYYSFLTSSFLNFQFPDLSTFLSLMPPSQKSELINSIPPPDLSELFRRPKVVDNNEELCTIFDNYGNTSNFLETQEDVPEDVRGEILPCVWPSALSSDTQEEADLWFEKRLKLYLSFLTKDLISSTETHSAKCLPFSKFVSSLGGSYNYDKADFTREDVYNTIKTYLSTGTKTKCYNATDPQLSSKAWFVNYIGDFIIYITLDDLNSFGTAAQLQPFSTNHANLQLFNHSSVPANVSNFFVELIFLEDSNFNPLLLPIHFRCRAPGSAFSQLNGDESMVILHNLTQLCTDLDPEVSAALAGNFETIKSDTIATLGNESVGLTTGQITAAKPSVILLSLSTLSVVTGWNQGQSITIVQSLLKTSFQIINVGHLEQLGSLVAGVPSELISSIDSTGILQTAGNPSFITNIMAAPQIIQQTYVNKIIAVDSQPAMLLENVPDAMATEIPRTLLEFPSNSHERINKKKWKYDQAVLLFETVANGFSEDPDQISSTVLQGFTCTRVQTFKPVRVRKLIRACRRKGPNKVVLRETQLTCMYNLIKDFDTSGFQLYPPDLLLYYNYDVVKTQCRTYFTEIGAANFDIISEALKDKKAILLDNAKTCLGITGTAISSENVEVLGNMCCTLDGSYIENSNPLILEKLKNCKDLSTGQIKSVEKLLFTGTTVYGSTATWDAQTLNSLGILPLYMTTDFWGHFNKAEKIKFLKSFMRTLRKNKTEKRKLKKLFKECNKFFRSKRAAESNCTTGIITQVEISSEAFPFGYPDTQFRICLTATTVKDNLAALAEKVDDDAFQEIILEKLNEAYPAGIPDEQVQVLGSVSRAASIDDISKWNITKIDTLAALMVADDGEWEPDKSEAIITKYLSTAGNSLGTAELNSIGGTNLCSLEASVLKGITPNSLKNANALTISNCSIEKKRELFSVAERAFSNRNTVSLDVYQLIESYLGGAPERYIKTLAASNVSMDMSTFTSLDPDVVNALSVNDVKLLLGSNLPDLKTFENQTIVQDWIKRQLQSELNGLGLNITGGRADPTPTGIGVINTTATGAVTTPIATTTGHGGPSTKSAHGLHLLLLAVVLTALHILQ
ncbi:hypothetical protein AGOR_G00092260 [Albula goreensis]|uniref:Mesothelin-like protein n=1 Tax=Albula goreensis TaxID=1534307 RepID=A0A8T3DJG8_9TELE|nr:hypothetical protein AGOR_G00092260 [Albula goreensis]